MAEIKTKNKEKKECIVQQKSLSSLESNPIQRIERGLS